MIFEPIGTNVKQTAISIPDKQLKIIQNEPAQSYLDEWIGDFIVDGLGRGICVVASVEGERFGRGSGVVQVGQGALVRLRVHEDAWLEIIRDGSACFIEMEYYGRFPASFSSISSFHTIS